MIDLGLLGLVWMIILGWQVDPLGDNNIAQKPKRTKIGKTHFRDKAFEHLWDFVA